MLINVTMRIVLMPTHSVPTGAAMTMEMHAVTSVYAGILGSRDPGDIVDPPRFAELPRDNDD